MLRDDPYDDRERGWSRHDRDDDDYREPRGGLPWRKILIGFGIFVGVSFLAVVGFIVAALQGLPSLADLQDYQPPVTSRVHAGDGALVAEFAREQRVFVPIEQIPDHVKNAFVAVEDARFFEHSGLDYQGLARAVLRIPLDVIQGNRVQGASTITQQVAGNMLTGRAAECSGGIGGLFCALWTKLREGLVAQRIERVLDKDRILELYLNQIYLGNRAFGVAAASLNYFNKPLSELTVSEAAYLAILPKGPANYQLPRNHDRAIDRRNYAISRMLERGYIDADQAAEARAADLAVTNRLAGDQFIAASHFVEEVRRQIEDQYGEEALYNGGLSIRSTIDTRLQLAAAHALRSGLEAYDRRYSWRGPLGAGDPSGDVQAQLAEATVAPQLSGWVRAMVTGTGNNITLTDENGSTGRLNSDDAQWAAQGARREASRALRRGAIVYAQRGSNGGYRLKQVPEIQGALVAMDPHTGRVLAMVGGYSFNDANGLNRATQAMRQPGSSFKPIVYAAALDFGLTPSTLIDDGPLAIEAGDGTNWSPENYSREYYGPTTLRRGLELSRNAMTARVAYELGPERVLQYGQRMGVYGDNTQAVFALALGAGETTVMRMTTAYGEFVNGGRRITPIIIDRIQDRTGRSVFRRDQRECPDCQAEWTRGMRPPTLPDTRQQIIDPITAYQIVSMSEGVVQRGTATVVNDLGFPLGGKTGTTNDYKDAWFIGYSPDLVVGVWAGFDTPRDMGEGETGGRIAAPIFRDFMREALRDTQPTPFRIPAGVRLVRVDSMTGLLPNASSTQTILEAFRPDTEPTRDVAASPFVFGGTDPIDPRVLSGLNQSDYGSEQQRERQQRELQEQQSEDLGGLY
jgi:penicillin-binding protein 1A